MYRIKTGLACKNRANGRGGSSKRTLFLKSLQNSKKFHQVLDFQGFAVLEWLWSKSQILDFQRFANIKQVLVFQRFCSGGRVGQG